MLHVLHSKKFRLQEGTMYLLWSRGSDILNFPMNYEMNETSPPSEHEAHNLHSPHRNSDNDGLIMAQLLRADKLVIPERYTRVIIYLLWERR